jgi:hypothetical protein
LLKFWRRSRQGGQARRTAFSSVRRNDGGSMLWFEKYFSPKFFLQKCWRFLHKIQLQNYAVCVMRMRNAYEISFKTTVSFFAKNSSKNIGAILLIMIKKQINKTFSSKIR